MHETGHLPVPMVASREASRKNNAVRATIKRHGHDWSHLEVAYSTTNMTIILNEQPLVFIR